MKKILILSLVVLFLFSACSSGGLIPQGAKTGTKSSEDRSGYGLEISFNLDDKDIALGRVYYTLNLVNSGKNPVVIREEDLTLITIEEKNRQNVFTSESVDIMKRKIFGSDSSITIYKDEEIEFSGILEINSPFREELYDSFEYEFKIEYDYRTDFNNNVEINIQDGKRTEFRILDSVSQAAPIQITKIDLKPGLNENEVTIEYTIEDRGRGSIFREDSKSRVDRIEILFGTTSIYGSCEAWYKRGGDYIERASFELIIDENKGDLVLFCKHFISGNNGEYTTKTSGYMEYRYVSREKGDIDFPEIRESPRG